MKKILIILITVFSLAFTSKAEAQVQVGVSFNTFYNELSPYGRWIDYPDYGRIWLYNRAGFRPYYDDGHWEYSNYGWAWVSDMPWGWAPFHYGRWAYIPAYGWAWVPGYEWAPAWVGWVQNSRYYGWAPLSPGLSINIGFNSIPRDRWCFVQQQYINNRNLRNHYINPANNVNVYNNVTVINNTQINNNITYTTGPQKADVERLTKKKIDAKPIAFSSAPGRTVIEKNRINIYRPDVNKPVAQVPDNVTSANTNAVPQLDRKKTIPQKLNRENIVTDPNNSNEQKPIIVKPQKTNVPSTVPVDDSKQQVQIQQKTELQNRIKQQQIDQQKIQQQNQAKQEQLQNEQRNQQQQQDQIRQQQIQDQQRIQQQQLNQARQEQLQNAQRQQAEQKLQRQQRVQEQRQIRQREVNRPVQRPATFENRQNNPAPQRTLPRRRS